MSAEVRAIKEKLGNFTKTFEAGYYTANPPPPPPPPTTEIALSDEDGRLVVNANTLMQLMGHLDDDGPSDADMVEAVRRAEAQAETQAETQMIEPPPLED